MGRADTVTKAYMQRSDIFADAFNFFIYGGRQVIRPQDLHELDANELALPHDQQGSEAIQKQRDLLKAANIMQDGQVTYLLLGIENQSEIHYAMPARNMLYDALQYTKQIEKAAAQHRQQKHRRGRTGGEYLSGFYREDKLAPVVTLVVFFGPQTWDGPRSLHEMMRQLPPEVLQLVQDYKLNLIEPATLTQAQLDRFQTSLREVLSFIKCSASKADMARLVGQDERFKTLERDAADVIRTCTGTKIEIDEHAEVVDLCKAWEDMRSESRAEGRAEGRAAGRLDERVKLIRSLMQNGGWTVQKAAEMAGLSPKEAGEVAKALGGQ